MCVFLSPLFIIITVPQMGAGPRPTDSIEVNLLLCLLFLDLSETAITIFSVLGLFSSQATASVCILFTAEIMPTIIRYPNNTPHSEVP